MQSGGQSEQFVRELTGCQQALFAYVLTLCPQREAAQEILQETNVVLWRKAAEFREQESFIAWACGVARYEMLAHRRRQARESLVFDDALVHDLATDAAQRAAEPTDRTDALKHCLGKLTRHQRELIEGRYAPGGSVRAMSDARNRGANGLSVLLSRIRRQLKECVERRLRREASS